MLPKKPIKGLGRRKRGEIEPPANREPATDFGALEKVEP